MSETIKVSTGDGHTIAVQPMSRNGEDGWIALDIYGPQGGLRAALELSPQGAGDLRAALKWLTHETEVAT